MYVCLCEAVTDHQIRALAQEGCTSMRQLGEQTGAGRCCGRCVPMARGILREYQESLNMDLLQTLAQPAA
ncbi:MAG: (2Fe-2S)-binding protein [Halomonadaceae bacterium]|nr:MAG: (2Fe-2S)-binding protein [Halomonadaceae bacterium]